MLNFTDSQMGQRRRLLFILGSIAILVSYSLHAQQTSSITAANWIEAPTSVSPPGMCCVAMTFDWVDRATLLFGGSYSGGGGTSNETWLWRNGWFRLSPAHSPSVRQGPGMTWDGLTGNVVLFGGTDESGTNLNDTWTWDGKDWTQQFPPISPPARRFDAQAMVYDAATRRVVLFGGVYANTGRLADTWSWDGLTRTWTQNHPLTSPSPRRTMLAYDYSAGDVVLFGGDYNTNNDTGVVLSDTWTWDGINWKRRWPVSSPSARTMGAMEWDSSWGAVVLFGGVTGTTTNTTDNDTWYWEHGSWTEVPAAGNGPPGRWAAGADYDPVSGALLLFGGFNFVSPFNDTWL